MGVVKFNRVGIFIFLCFLFIQLAGAQESKSKSDSKSEKSFLVNDDHWSIEVPIWVPGFRGDFVYGDVWLEGEDDANPENPIEPGWKPGDNLSRIFGKNGSLNFFFMNRVSYRNRKLYSQFDVFSGSVGGSIYFRYNDAELVKAKFSTYLFRLFAGYKFYEKLSVSEKCKYKLYGYGGLRIHSVNVKSDLDFTERRLNVTPLWAEPILGARNELAFKNWLFVLQGDIGSFSIDQKMSYMINFYSFYRISKLLSVKVGWCSWDMNYRDKFREEDLKLIMHLSGPATALTFHF